MADRNATGLFVVTITNTVKNTFTLLILQKVARTLHLSPVRDPQPVPERSPDQCNEENATITGSNTDLDKESAIETNSVNNPINGDTLLPTERSIAVSPIRQDILDRDYSPAPALAPYRHHHRFANATATPTPRTHDIVAGLSTEKADRYRMNRSSGKRFRSPARTSLWEDYNDTYTYQDTASNKSATTLSHKRITRSTAERTFDSHAVSQALNMTPMIAQSSHREHQSNQTGPDALNVANHAAREFLRDENWKQLEPPQLDQINTPEDTSHTTRSVDSHRKSKRVSFDEETARTQPRTLPILADKTTQTDESLWPPRAVPRMLSSDEQAQNADASVRRSACEDVENETGRPRKVMRHSVPVQQPNFRRSSSHLTNPILINPRHPPEPTTFRRRPASSTVINDRLAWR